MMKKVTYLLLGTLMAIMMVGSNTSLAEAGPHMYCEASDATIEVGGLFTLTLKTSSMSISTFTGGVFYDPTLVEPVSFGSGETLISTASGGSLSVSVMYGESNNIGLIGIGTSEEKYEPSTLVTLTFKAISTGEAVFTLYESTDGTDGFNSDGYEGITITIAPAGESSDTASGTSSAAGTSGASLTDGSSEYDAEEESGGEESTFAREEAGTKGAVSTETELVTPRAASTETETELVTPRAAETLEGGEAFPLWIPIAIAVVVIGIVVTIILLKKKK